VLARAKQVLAQLEGGTGPGGSALILPADMPLFSIPAQVMEETAPSHPALEKLRDLDADNLSPRDALAALYDLKALL
jgi:DNA mismatch repair protein MutS